MKPKAIEVINLSKAFLDRNHNSHMALSHLNLEVNEGEVFGIMGMSGAGKSTLLRCLTGLEKQNEGTIVIQGKELKAMKRAELSLLRKEIGMVFQHFYLFSSRTVAQNIAYAMEIHQVGKQAQEERVDELLDLVGLEQKKQAYPSRLSGGEKQRVGIARALANHPKILLCDEPTSALDPKTTRSILELLQQLNKRFNLTIVIITHQIEVVKNICTQVAVLAEGTIVEQGEVSRVFSRPQHKVTRHLLHYDDLQLPENFTKHPLGTLVRLTFEGDCAKEPLISRMIRKFPIEVNILLGGLDCIRHQVVGRLVVELIGASAEVNRAIVYLRHNHVLCEEV